MAKPVMLHQLNQIVLYLLLPYDVLELHKLFTLQGLQNNMKKATPYPGPLFIQILLLSF
jgi:hypothetical protein